MRYRVHQGLYDIRNKYTILVSFVMIRRKSAGRSGVYMLLVSRPRASHRGGSLHDGEGARTQDP